jgi:hypothetical protein
MSPRAERVLTHLTPVFRWRYPIVAAAALLSSAQHVSGTGRDWFYFVKGSELLFGRHHLYSLRPGGLHLYANYPDLQIGPLSFVVATPLRMLGPDDGRVASSFLMSAFVVFLVFVLERTARRVWVDAAEVEIALRSLTVLLGGVMVAQAWAPLSTIYAHLDDVVTLGACVGALWAVATKRPVLLGVLIGAAAAAKPWGVLALPLAFALEGRDRWRAFTISAACTLVAWLPFAIADGGTLTAVTPQNMVSPSSILHLFGVPVMDGPTWTRPVQLAAMLLVGAIAVARGRWGAVLLVGVAARLAFDPQVFLYYSSGLILAALAWDLLRTPRPLPWWTFFTFLLLNDAYVLVGSDTTRAVLRLVLTAALISVVLFAPRGALEPQGVLGPP